MLNGQTILLTAGPTWEAIDPVRGISNHSSGKMGYALATTAKAMGAKVVLVSGPVCLPPPQGIETISIESALQMYDAVHHCLQTESVDIFISVAAVADYRPAEVQSQKIKKSTDELTLRLVKNPDIVASVAALQQRRPYTVGFAAETQQLETYARGKLQAKHLDMIIANDVSEAGVGFGATQNRIVIITETDIIRPPKQSKARLSETILNTILNQINYDSKRTS